MNKITPSSSFPFVSIIIVLGIVFLVLGSHTSIKKTPKASNAYPIDSAESQFSSDLKVAVSQVEKANIPEFGTDWRVYQIQAAGTALTIKHPAGLLLHESMAVGTFAGNGLDIYYDTPDNRTFLAGGDREKPPGMHIAMSNPYRDAEEYLKQTRPKQVYATTMLFGQKALVYTGQGMNRWDVILLVHNNILYEVTIEYGSVGDGGYSTFYQILSSFTF
jgi:hypothetical protein